MIEKVAQHLKRHPLFVNAHGHCVVRDNFIYIGFQTGPDSISRGHHFDIQLSGYTLYLLSIEIEEANRGQGLGLMLYSIIEDVAREFGCRQIEMTPSGWTNSGETRKSYIMRKLGYKDYGQTVVKEL